MISYIEAGYYLAQSQINPAQQIADLKNLFEPILYKAVAFGMKVCLGIVSAQAFYTIIIKLTKV